MADRRSKRISTFGSRITSLVSVALVLLVVGVASMVGIAAKGLTDDVRSNIGFIIKMERDCDAAAVADIKQALLSGSGIERFSFASAEDIMAQEQVFLGEDLAAELDANPYSAEFDVKVKPAYATPDSVAALVALYGQAPQVAEIVTESAVIEGVDKALKRIGIVLLAVAIVLLVVSVALINNTVSLAIYGRRFIIHTMKLVGATAGFIRRPFILAGAIDGFIAGVSASALIVALRAYVAGLDSLVGHALTWPSVTILCVCLTIAGMAVCMLTAFFASTRYLRASYDEMFLK